MRVLASAMREVDCTNMCLLKYRCIKKYTQIKQHNDDDDDDYDDDDDGDDDDDDDNNNNNNNK
jgi:hypothetical protein